MPDLLPDSLKQVFATEQSPEAVLQALMPAIAQLFQSDRCFLYLRHPQTQMGKVAFCWCRSSEFPDMRQADWHPEPESLAQEDPLFAAALHCQPSVYVEDVETASPDVVNRAFEAKHFGHRALIHAHLCHEQQLWGILQPCVFGQPRSWSPHDREMMTQVEAEVTPIAVRFVETTLG